MARSETIAKIRARGKLTRARVPRPPRQVQPDTLRVAYFATLRKMVKRMREILASELLPELRSDAAREDANKERVSRAIRRAAARVGQEFPDRKLGAIAEEFADRTSKYQRAQFGRQVRAVLSIDIVKAEPFLKPLVGEFVRENVALIKTVPARYFAEVEAVTLAGVQSGLRHEELAKQIEERGDVSESNAKRIARDQVGKFYGQVNEARQKNLGVTGYIWETSNDNRVRDEHFERQGEHFEWTDPPEDGHPGMPINCRCYASPDLTELLDGGTDDGE